MMEKKEALVKFFKVWKIINKFREKKGISKDKEKVLKQSDEKKTIKLSPAAKDMFSILLAEGSLNQRSVAKRTGISPQGVSDMIKKLELKGVLNEEHGAKYNENILTLTEEGKKIAIKIEEHKQQVAEDMFNGFTDEEIDIFYTLLQKVESNIVTKLKIK